VFGDGSFFAILTPGHTTGHVSYLARTAEGAVLMTGDVSHTRWGWDRNVQAGTYLQVRGPSIKSNATSATVCSPAVTSLLTRPKAWELSPEQASPSFTSGQTSTGWSQDHTGSTP
jgi:glyoxylase-like metal-dependent hydrolase (beta-lactamase superfamily II)